LKPNIFSVLFTRYTKERLVEYLHELKTREYKTELVHMEHHQHAPSPLDKQSQEKVDLSQAAVAGA